MGAVTYAIRSKLEAAFAPSRLEITDDSHRLTQEIESLRGPTN